MGQLRSFLLSDGLGRLAFSVNFLPDFFCNGKANPYIGLARSFSVFAGIVASLELAVTDYKSDQGQAGRLATAAKPKAGKAKVSVQQKHYKVDVSDLAKFSKEVRCTEVFESLPANLATDFSIQTGI